MRARAEYRFVPELPPIESSNLTQTDSGALALDATDDSDLVSISSEDEVACDSCPVTTLLTVDRQPQACCIRI